MGVTWRPGAEVDYDPFAEPSAETAAPTAEAANQTAAPTPPPESKPVEVPTITVPSAKRYPLPKVVREDDHPKKTTWRAGEITDVDPFAAQPADTTANKGSFIPEAAKAVAGGATGATGGILRGGGAFRQLQMVEEERRAARQKALEKLGYTGITKFADLPIDKQKELRDALMAANDSVAPPDITEDPFYKAGIATRDWGDTQFKAAHDYENSWTRSIGEGLGSTLPYLAAGTVAGPAGFIVGTGMGALGSAGDAVDAAVKAGASKEQILQAVRLGTPVGLSEQLPIEVILGKVPLPAMGKVLGAIVKVGAKMAAEGTQEGMSQLAQNLISKYVYKPGQDPFEGVAQAAGIGAIVGGIAGAPETILHKEHEATNEGEEQPAKPDDIPDKATPVQPEGTPAAVPADNAGGTPTPGGTGAPPSQPVGAGKQPAPAGPAANVPATDTRTETKPPQPAPSPGVTVVTSTQVAPDVSAALGGAASAPAQTARTATAPVAGEQEFNLAEETPEGENISDIEKTHRDLFKGMFAEEAAAQRADEAEQRSRSASTAIPNVVTGADPAVAAALKEAGAKVQPETLGTGIALTRPNVPPVQSPATQEAAPVTPVTPAAAADETAAPAADVAQQPAAAYTPQDAVAAPAPSPLGTATATAPVSPSLGASEAAPAPSPTGPVAREPMPAATPAAAAPEQLPPAPVTVGPAQAVEPAAPKAEAAKAVSRGKITLKPREGRTEAPAAEAPVVRPTAPSAPAKAAAAKETSKRKQTPSAPVVERVTREDLAERERQRAESIARDAEERKAREAARPRLARDIHRDAKDELRRELPDITEADLQRLTEEESDKAAAEAEKDQSPAEKIRHGVPKVVERVRERAEQEEHARREAHRSEEEIRAERAKAKKAEEKVAEAAKQQEQAAAESGQKKERAGSEKGKSETGILAQKEKTTKIHYDAEKKKPESEQNPALMAWGRAYDARTGTKGEEREARQRDVDEALARYAKSSETARVAAEEERLAARSKAVEKTVKPALEKVPPIPPLTGSDANKMQTIKLNMLRMASEVTAAMKASGQELGQRIDTARQSPAENFAIYTRQVISNLRRIAEKAGVEIEKDNSTHGVVEYMMAKEFYDSGSTDQLYNLIKSENLRGTGGAGPRLDVSGDVNTAEAVSEGDERGDLARREQRQEASYDPTESQARKLQPKRRPQALVDADEGLITDENPHVNDVMTDVLELHAPRHSGGQLVRAKSKTMTGRQALSSISQLAHEEGGLIGVLRKHLIKHLTRLVGDVNVHIIPDDAIQQLSGYKFEVAGLYFDHRDADRAWGHKPIVLINASLLSDPDQYIHTVLHEMTHAATSQALRLDLRGTGRIFETMRKEMHKQVLTQYTREELEEYGLDYAFTDAAEFVAETFSNTTFQHLLMQVPMTPRVQLALSGLAGRGRITSWWDAAVAGVSNAIGMMGGKRTNTYMHGVMRLFPEAAQSSREQLEEAERQTFGATLAEAEHEPAVMPRPLASGPNDLRQFDAERQSRVSGLLGLSAGYLGRNSLLQKARNAFTTTASIDRRAAEITGDDNNGLSKLARLLQRKDPLKAKLRGAGAKLQLALLDLQRTGKDQYRALSRIVHESSRYKLDPRYDISHEANGHIEKTGERHRNARAELARQHAEWNKLSPKAKEVGDMIAEHYSNAHDQMATELYRHAIWAAMKKYRQAMPAGETVDTIADWVKSGDAAREGDSRTQRDIDLHKALGKTAATLADIPAFKKPPGLYSPLTRRGRNFIHGRKTLETPDGAVADPAAKDGNRFFFPEKNKAKLQDFLDSTEMMTRVHTMHVDPATGEKIAATEPNAVKVYVATVQNKFLEMHDSVRHLEQRRQELREEGFEMSQVREVDDLYKKNSVAMTPEISRLISNLEQTTAGQSTVSQDAVRNMIVDAQIRAMTNPGYLQRRLKRKGVLGYDVDLAAAQRDHDTMHASHLANLKLAPEMAEAETELKTYLDQQSRNDYGDGVDVLAMDRMRNEVAARMKSASHQEKGGLSHAINVLQDLSFMSHLLTPRFWAMQSAQLYQTTYPLLSSRFGEGGTHREMLKALSLFGVNRKFGRGFGELARHGKALIPFRQAHVAPEELEGWGVHDKAAHDRVAGEDDAAALRDLFADVRDEGYGAGGGLDTVSLGDKGASGYLNKWVNFAKAIPEAAEGTNRYVTATAAYRLAVRDGMGHEQAKRYAINAVEQTQGGYAPANSPRVFRHPVGRVALQFKKYGVMFGQAYYGNLVRMFDPRSSAETRKVAAKTFFKVSMMLWAFAGVGGQPVIEMARLAMNLAFMLGLTDDDWDDDEAAMQGLFKQLAGAVGFNEATADRIGEVAMHGLPRAVGLDLSASMGADNLLTFGSPRTMDEQGTIEWLFKQGLGAAGSMAWDTGKDLINGDYRLKPLWPKILQDIDQAIQIGTEGAKSKRTGEVYGEPVSLPAAIAKGAGFQPASEAERFERGGSGRAAKKLKQLHDEKSAIMKKWDNANASGKSRIYNEDVQEWNATHSGKDRINYHDLLASHRSRERRKKQVEEAQAEEE